MAEELNGRLSSQLHNSSTDQLHQSLRLLVRKIRAQLEVLTKKNKLKEDENTILNNQISSLKQQISNLESTLYTITTTESKYTDEITELNAKLETESQRHSTIETELLKQISVLRTEKEELNTSHQIQTETLTKEHQHTLNTEKQNFENLRQQKLSSDHKLQEIMQNNDVLHSKLKELQQKQQHMSSMTDTQKNELETRMESLKTENINYLSKIQQLKKEISAKDQEINDIGTSLLSMQNDIQCLETQSESNNIIITEFQTKLKQSEEELMKAQTQYKQIQDAFDKLMDTAKEMNKDSFWNLDEVTQQNENENDNENSDDVVLETTAHPFNIDIEHNKRLERMQMIPLRVQVLQKQLSDAEGKVLKEKDTMNEIQMYWKNKIKELNTKNTDLSARMENLERMVDSLSSHNDRLIKENDSLKTEMHNHKFTSSAHEIYLQMKTKEEAEKMIELQQELDVLQDDVLRKSALISKLEKNHRITKQSMLEQKKLHQTEMAQLTDKLNLLTQLSQEEIQQTFHVTIQELQSILDQNMTTDTEMNDGLKEEKKQEIDTDHEHEHLLSPKLKVPHITDSDVGDNDDAEIIEAEDKLASYFARHKERQIVITNHDKKASLSVSVEPIEEANEVNEDECDEKQVVIVDGDENILTPPLQEEAPYIVWDDTLCVDGAIAIGGISNVSVSNVAVSNCSTRGNSTRGDQSPNSIKIDEPPTKADEETGTDMDKEQDENKGETPDIMDANTEKKNDVDVEREEKVTDDDAQILHSLQPYLSGSTSANASSGNAMCSPLQGLQPLQQRARSMGSVATTIDDLQSVDQSIVAHDGSRDGSVVPEPQLTPMYTDDADPDAELINADMETTNSNAFPLQNLEEYVVTQDIAGTETINSIEIHSVDDIHQEAHQIIEDLQCNLKELQNESKGTCIPTIVHEHESMDHQITDDDILSPAIERQHNHNHDAHDIDKQRKILNAAKAKWSRKVEEMIAHTDSWFINEDGDIVLIYPEADIVDGDGKETIKDVNAEDGDMDIEDGANDEETQEEENVNVQKDEENEETEIKNEEVVDMDVDEGNADADENANVCDDIDHKKDEMIMNEKHDCDDENEDNVKETILIQNNNENADSTADDANIKKNENFFNSFRIF